MIPFALPEKPYHGRCHGHAECRAESRKRHKLFWVKRFHLLPSTDQRWARCVARFEIFGTPWRLKAQVWTGTYGGSTQFLPATWRAAGGSGYPQDHSLHEQLYRAVRWGRRAGWSQWSTSARCGR